MNSIDEHIQKDQSEIQSAQQEGNIPKLRHLTEELHSLEEYKEHHPDDKHDPNALELFCDANPDEPECLVYDDQKSSRQLANKKQAEPAFYLSGLYIQKRQ